MLTSVFLRHLFTSFWRKLLKMMVYEHNIERSQRLTFRLTMLSFDAASIKLPASLPCHVTFAKETWAMRSHNLFFIAHTTSWLRHLFLVFSLISFVSLVAVYQNNCPTGRSRSSYGLETMGCPWIFLLFATFLSKLISVWLVKKVYDANYVEEENVRELIYNRNQTHLS